MVVGDEVVEVEADRDSGMRTGVIVQGATRQVAVLLGDAEARAMIVEVQAGARHRGGESAIIALREVAAVDEGVARAIQMLATGAIAVTAAVAAVGTVADVGDSARRMYKKQRLKNGTQIHVQKSEPVIVGPNTKSHTVLPFVSESLGTCMLRNAYKVDHHSTSRSRIRYTSAS